MKRLSLGYFADGPWSHQTLARLLRDESIDIRFIAARFDSPDPVIRAEALAHHIDCFVHPNINADDFLQRVEAYRCEVLVSMSFDQVFRRRIIGLPPLGIINCHAGKLPFYRGRNVLNWVLINDEREFGITVHYVDEGIDTGDIIAQSTHAIGDDDTYATLLDRALFGCADLLYSAIKNIQAGTVVRTPQSSIDPLGTYCSKRGPGDEHLNWNQPSRDVFNFVRAICRPGPQARTLLRNQELAIDRLEWLPGAQVYRGFPGAVLKLEGRAFLVKTEDSCVRVVDWSGVDRVRVGDRLT